MMSNPTVSGPPEYWARVRVSACSAAAMPTESLPQFAHQAWAPADTWYGGILENRVAMRIVGAGLEEDQVPAVQWVKGPPALVSSTPRIAAIS